MWDDAALINIHKIVEKCHTHFQCNARRPESNANLYIHIFLKLFMAYVFIFHVLCLSIIKNRGCTQGDIQILIISSFVIVLYCIVLVIVLTCLHYKKIGAVHI